MDSLEILQKNYVLNKLTVEHLSLLKEEINMSTGKIESNFELNINLLKQIKNEVTDDKAEEMLSVVLFNMKNYISILQCEDKLFQMIDGVSNYIDSSSQEISKNVQIHEDIDKIKNIKEDTVKFYTIQDQRDLALGAEPCDVEDSELTLF